MFDKSNFKDIYSLSPMQQGMLFHSIMDSASGAYFEHSRLEIIGEIDIKLFERSFNFIIEKYDILRTVFLYEKVSQPVQIVLRKRMGNILYNDISALKEEERNGFIEDFIKKDKMQGFKLSIDLPMRIAVIKTGEKEYEIIWSYHHIIMDGWCLGIIMSEFFKAYSLLGKGKEISVVNNYPYSDYIKWLKKQNKEKALAYWKNYLEDYEQQASIPRLHKKSNDNTYLQSDIQFELDEAITEKLTKLARENQISLNIIIQTIWGILLQRYNNTNDVVFGAVVSGRPPEVVGIESMVGLFINTIPVRIQKDEISFIELSKEIQENASKSMAYDYMPLADVQASSMLKNSLFDHIMIFENYPVDKQLSNMESGQELGFSIQDYEMFEHTNYDFNMAIIPGDTIIFKLTHNENVYSKELVEQIGKHFKIVIDQILEKPDINAAKISIVDDEEKHQLLVEFNNTKVEYTKDKTLYQLFEEQAAKTPDNIAAMYEEESITYKELDSKSNQLASILREKGVKADSIVAISLYRSLEMTIGIMAIQKAGGAYLPIGPEYPEDRIRYMLEDSNANILLTQSHLKGNYKFENIDVIAIDDKELYKGDISSLQPISGPNNLAYVIYTSGSTGKPKGVMIEHHSVINRTKWMQKRYPIGENDVILQRTPYTFDVSVGELFWWSMTGAKVCFLTPGGDKDPEEIVKAIEKYKVTTMNFVPSMMNIFLEHIEGRDDIDRLSSLRQVFSIGEALTVPQVERFNRILNSKIGTKLINIYGPTETTVEVSYFDCSTGEKFDIIPIGKPIDNISLLVLDKYNNLLPVGVPGELCISGVGVGRGYQNRPELTAEKFLQNPHIPGERMYRSGDLARWLPNGNVEYLGRMDNQVKIRGNRIELGEIENELLKHKEIKEAIVIDKTDKSGNKYLCGYIVVERELTVAELKEHLLNNLPDYMVPAYFISLDKLPLSANGKADRKALPEPDGNINTGVEYIAPSNEIEEKLANIWSEVLGIEKIGINDNFFELGGHSLKAINVIAKINKELNVSVPLTEMFKTPKIKGLTEYIKNTKQSIYSSVEPVEEKEYYELSSAQKRMYTLQQLEENSTSYNMSIIMKLEGELDKTKLEENFNKLIKRHEALRTYFEVIETEPVQLVQKEVSIEIEYMEENEEKAGKIAAGFVKAFDLSKVPLLRVALTKINDKEHILMIDMHHIISDGVSMGILTNEFIELYDGKELPKLRIQYKDFAAWQNELFKSEEIKKQEEYWLKAFEGEVPVLNLPTDYQRPSLQSFEGDNVNLELSEELTNKLKQIAKETGSTMYMVLLSACNILLSKYSGQEDIVIGSPIAGRPHADLQNIMGMFVNTLAMRNYPESNKTFKEFLNEVKASSLQAFENQDYQFEELIDKLNITRDLSRNPLFDVMFSMQNMNTGELQMEGLKFEPYEINNNIAKFDITITAIELDKTIGIDLNYCTKLFSKQIIQNMSKHLINILNSITSNTNLRLSEVEMLSEEEKHQLLVEFNNTKTEYPKDKTIQQLFEEQETKTPDNIAVVLDNKHLTYRQLNEKANQLARTLRIKGVKADSIVAMMVDRSLEMIIGIMAVLKAGGAYLPIDHKYPQDRIEYMIEDSGASILLTQAHIENKASINCTVINIDNEELYTGDSTNLEHINKSDNLAYVIYTSGSTGKPKGNLTMHYNITRVVKNTNYIEINAEDNILQLSNYAFDGSTFDIYGALLNGAKLLLVDRQTVIDINKLSKLIEEENITIFFVTTALFNALVDINIECLKNVRKVLFGGERVSLQHAKKALEYMGKDRIIHVYGPTESTVYATYYFINVIYEKLGTVPIGSPISNTEIYILNRNDKLQPIGISGELCISGDGLAKGYLNREELTKEKFVQSTYKDKELIYRTGDLARWLPDGSIEFIGRIDHQVKIRGFRIELGEIENELLKHNKIREAIVIAKEDNSGNKYLCGYVAGEVELSNKELREHLSKNLPEYMIPAYFINLDKLPLTANGKVDRKALPEPDGSISTGAEYVAPSSEIEEKLVNIWSEVLGIEKIGINDNFFELGGHSLKAINISAKISKELNVSVPLREMFKTPTIKGIANYVEGTKQSIYSKIESAYECEYYPLSSAQKRIYTLQQFEENSTSYNMPIVMTLEGELDKSKLEESFNKLIQRHEALRTSFDVIDGEPVQIVHKEVSFAIEYTEASKEKAGEITEVFVKAFDLSKAPLIRVVLVKINNKEHILMIDKHHIISDGVSMGILTKEFIELYDGKELPKLRIQYKDFAVWQNELFKSGEIKKQEEYWLRAFEGEVPVLNMPVDHQRPSIQSFEGDSIGFELNEELTDKLKQIARKTGSTMYMVLLSACNVLLSKYSGQEDIVIGSPIAGRRHADLQNIMGMFVNTLAMRNYPESNKTFKEFLVEVKANSLQAFENQDYQFEELIDKLSITRDLSRNPLFDVMFTMQNMDAGELQIEGLRFKPYEFSNNIAKFDMTITATELDKTIGIDLNYCTKLFNKQTIENMSKHLTNILDSIANNINLRLSELEMLSEQEKHQLLVEFNDTKAEYPKDKTIYQLFEQQAAETPDDIAVTYGEEAITYKELDTSSNQLARTLREKGAKPNSIVAIIVDRSFEMIIGIMGILKAGAAYLPIDPEYPEDRISYILEDSKTELLLTQSKYIDKVEFAGEILNLESKQIYANEGTKLDNVNSPKDLAYILYTSGSTGNPKGVMIEHESAVNTLTETERNFPVAKEDVYLLKTTYTFDVSVMEIFGWFIGNGKLAILKPGDEKDISEILNAIEKYKVTHINFVPSMLNLFWKD